MSSEQSHGVDRRGARRKQFPRRHDSVSPVRFIEPEPIEGSEPEPEAVDYRQATTDGLDNPFEQPTS